MADIVIQIVNYNTKKYLDDCIVGVISDLKNATIKYKILVLDNDSKDDLSGLEERYANEQIEFYYSQKNLGFGAGHNFLAKKAESKYILILNPDLKFIEPKTVERAYEYIDKQRGRKIAAVGPKLINEKGVQVWDHGVLDGFLGRLANGVGVSCWRNDKKRLAVAWVSGAFFFTNRRSFEAVGGFDDNFFLYGEEVDLCLRLRELSYSIMYLPEIKVFHYGSVVASKKDFFVGSNSYFLEKHFRKRGIAVYHLALFLHKLISWFIKFF